MKLKLNLDYRTKFGEKLQIVLIEKQQESRPFPMHFDDLGGWSAELDYFSKSISYKYQLTDEQENILDEELSHHNLNLANSFDEFLVYDVWNLKNFPENYLNNKILINKLPNFKKAKVAALKKHTHLFRMEAPLYNPDWQLVILGNVPELGNWEYLKTLPMSQTEIGVWEAAIELKESGTILYKYGILDKKSGEIIAVENGDNRWVLPNSEKNVLCIKADHFFKFNIGELYHAAGVAVPVFSLRSQNSFGVGEFEDIKLLADWTAKTKLDIIQILPINDTTANYSWTDSYPYAAISVYALHPQYLNIEKLDFPVPEKSMNDFQEAKKKFNDLDLIDYEGVITQKWAYIRNIFGDNKDKIYKDRNFKKFLKENEFWLLPYAAFCVQRDKYKTPNFNSWKTHKKYIPGKISAFFNEKNKEYDNAMLHCWVQYQLHIQLKSAVDYAHSLGISIKGDLPIGIYRYSVEAWTELELFGMDFQAGAPPDQFTDLGQNWGFPTYNWEAMKANGYTWWKNRFRALEQYFDAMRIDHILGFFRIWRMPVSATQGILGYFYPAHPVTLEEFQSRNIQFDYERFCKPFINEEILRDNFGDENENISDFFMNRNAEGNYSFKQEFDTQRKLQDYFEQNPHPWAEDILISLCANVLFIAEDKNGVEVYHPRFNVYKTSSYKYLSDWEKSAIYALYVDYFFKRQDTLWYQSAMEKLPVILNSTKMLICGEDLGLVPDCVPVVMDKLAITALKVQRMPSENIDWYDPNNATYLNVVTASSHDSSTLRQWWQENRAFTQKYFNYQLNQYGTAPWELHPKLAEIIMLQHLHNNAMLAIFPLQEFLATDKQLKNKNQDNERINDPARFPHYWRYRMHLTLEELANQSDFNNKVALLVADSKRDNSY